MPRTARFATPRTVKAAENAAVIVTVGLIGMTSLTEHARAKVNLTLRVVGRRPDGYHDLESVVAFADCADRITLKPGAETSLALSGPSAQDCGETADNLVIKGVNLLAGEIPGLAGGKFQLEKVLPVAAGIGGGSADAAAALRCLARANDLAADDARLFAVARAVGADVPVCLPSQACVMSGVGDQLAPLVLPPLPCVLVNPRVGVATAAVFNALGLRHGELRAGATDILAAVAWPGPGASRDEWIAALDFHGNDLEAPAISVAPVIGEVLEELRVLDGARLARMSGSGATCFALFDDDAQAQAAAGTLRQAHPQWWVHAGTLS